ncbi:hypothetical protein BDV28DRAFT_151348 [Aspergillus coremiiformis]|uniref:Isopenicillin N synthase-like Fe(2+) 2OG dioxygenase domain-containing protein n=1 Tax=Aspergillus coremiiformis TaxID=138285 RepID=A0A5N6YXX0_9EURO|nr:hypothetical protein BDV28DRAFT_151348 [Aspergillus coremiiformis]
MPTKLIDRYNHVPVTQENLDWAELVNVDLSQYDRQGGRQNLVKQLDHAVRHVASPTHYALPLEEKLKYYSRADLDRGEYNGYRPAGDRPLGNGVKDIVQVYNLLKFDGYHQRQHPRIPAEHIEEIEGFSRKCHNEVGEKLFDSSPSSLNFRTKTNSSGIIDTTSKARIIFATYTSTTLLFRQPVAALQILNSEGQWKWVRPQDGTISLNTGDALTTLTGGLIKSSIHRVRAPPADQAHVDRLGVSYFARELFLSLWVATVEKKLKRGAHIFRRKIDVMPHNKAGGLWHRPLTYPNQMWLDGIHMPTSLCALYIRHGSIPGTLPLGVILYSDLIDEQGLRKDGLLAHGFDYSKSAVWTAINNVLGKNLEDPETGAASLVWNRALGWYFISPVHILDSFPKSHDKSGGW